MPSTKTRMSSCSSDAAPNLLLMNFPLTSNSNRFLSYAAAMHSPFVPPSINVTFGQRISSKSTMTGFTSVKTGAYQIGPWGDPKYLPSMAHIRPEFAVVSVGVTNQNNNGRGWTVQSTMSGMDQSISTDYNMKVLGGVKLKFGASIGTGSGLSLNANGERRVTENIRFGLGVSAAQAGGTTLRLKFNRLGQKITIPIILAPEFRSDLLMACTAIPAAGMSLFHYYYILPNKRKRIESTLKDLRKQNEEMIRERREAAVSAIDLLQEQARKKWQIESNKGGLVIVEAWYGKRSAFPAPLPGDAESLERAAWESGGRTLLDRVSDEGRLEEEEEPPYCDVRIPLQCMISKGQLVIPGGRAKVSDA